MRDPAPPRAIVAVVIEGSSFFVAAWRSIMSAAMLVARGPYPAKIFATREQALQWLERETRTWKSPAHAEAFAETVRHVEMGLEPP